jgi:RNA polymerase sigma-70 factor (ECF subfamily)
MPISPDLALNALTDEELILRFQNGDESAFVVLVRRYKNPLTNFIARFLGEVDDANDIVQETFVRVYSRRQTFNPVAKFSTWLYRIALNLATSTLRHETRRRRYLRAGRLSNFAVNRLTSDMLDTALTPDSRLEGVLVLQLVHDALQQVSPAFREVIVLRDIQDLTYEEIAGITGLELGTIKSRINRGRAQLQKLLRSIYVDETRATV